MPNLNSFLSGFGLYNGLQVGYYMLNGYEGEHKTISRYHDYEYPIKFQFIYNGPNNLIQTIEDANNVMLDLLYKFQTYISGNRIIKSDYGNPYECYFSSGVLTDNVPNRPFNVTITALGKSHRIYI
ncbi:Hypothetical protein ORPV_258 [Orpheovirus IHUMI-LCC2]|uniref:Uncharacterized protein n=1 Tax=Orpheovirus IHUMI-LCC2 TaxID=2023057 RepID=A0A2I2L3P3_9VIRU|nr:Hypothetical protein ORPV_258 [Orpheovirus IHUMI-LCC2]SNW62162.1 Hypothetical protein ORPV_258 [Orpheovirus IHUMI-LCC2]